MPDSALPGLRIRDATREQWSEEAEQGRMETGARHEEQYGSAAHGLVHAHPTGRI